MGADIKLWPKAQGEPKPLPARIVRPCDYALRSAIFDLEQQLGTIEACNRLIDAASLLHEKIKAGTAQAQNPLFAKDPKDKQ